MLIGKYNHQVKGLVLLATILLFSCEQQESSVTAPDLILTNASVITMDKMDSVAEAVAVTGNKITAVGSSADLEQLAGPETTIIDLEGNTVSPGIIDTHNHFAVSVSADLNQMDVEYPSVKSIQDIRLQLQQSVANKAPGDWILGWGWDAAKLDEKRNINASDLDDLTPNNPVWLGHTSAHYGVANSQALALAGIDSDTPNPDGGVIERDRNGVATGILTDQAMDFVNNIIPEAPRNYVKAITKWVGDLSAEGITTIKDPEIYQEHWDAYKTVEQQGGLSVRVFTLWRVPDTLDDAKVLLHHIKSFTQPLEQDGSSLVISGGVKIYIDGSGTVRTAWVHEDWNQNYTDVDEGNRGLTYIAPNVLSDQIKLFHDAGVHIGTHAIGDRAIDFTMTSYDQVLESNPIIGLRHSIIHSNLPTDYAMDLMVKLQRKFDTGYPEVQPAFLWWIGDTYVANFGPERSLRVLPLRTFENRGILWAGSSDFDVSPYALRHAFWAASTRQPMLGTHGTNPWGTDETVSIHETLRAYTATASRQVFLEDKIGTIEVGKLADIVAWDRNLYTIPTHELKEVKATLTIMNGEIVYPVSNQPR